MPVKVLPSAHLNLAYQDLTEISPKLIEQAASVTTSIDVTGNRFFELRSLCDFVNLHTIICNKNNLESHASFPQFPHLHHLSINENNITNLSTFILHLSRDVPKLKSLSMLKNEAAPSYFNGGTKMQNDDYRQFVISHFGYLGNLDGQQIIVERSFFDAYLRDRTAMFRRPFQVKKNVCVRASERRKLRENVLTHFPNLKEEELSCIVPKKEDIFVSKLVTYSGKMVTCYFLNKEPILFEVDQVLLPTVYLLWKLPSLLLKFEISSNVLLVISGGADLMFAGIHRPECGFSDFLRSSPCAILLKEHNAVVAVGVTSCSNQDLLDSGTYDKRIVVYHCYKDQLWLAGSQTRLPNLPSEEEQSHPVDETEESLKPSPNENNDETEAAEELVLSPQESMDLLLSNCFYQALINAKKVELPILVSSFTSRYLYPICPEGQRIDIKRSSYKKMSKFLSEMKSKGIVQVEELTKGVESITAISLKNDIIKTYKTSLFAHEMNQLTISKDDKSSNPECMQQVRDMYAVSANVLPFFKLFELSKGSAMIESDIRKLIMQYVKNNELARGKKVQLDALLTDVLYGKSKCEDELTWDVLLRMMKQRMNPCYEITLPGEKPVVRKGHLEQIEVSVEQRMGNKKVTVVKNLEVYGVNMKTFASELQQMAASSTTVAMSTGKNPITHNVIVQGVQLKHIKALLESHKIPLKFLKDLTEKEKKKK